MERRVVEVRGVVQGVGFRPFVQHLALRHRLVGFVHNAAGGVRIEIQGPTQALDAFLHDLSAFPPAPSRIDDMTFRRVPCKDEHGFRVVASKIDADELTLVSPDLAACDDCLRECTDPNDRRWSHPFAACTRCGPRFTIVTGVPYDRERTTMTDFALCAACRAEYADPNDRRFHAQAIACPACGPRLRLFDAGGAELRDPLASFAEYLRHGGIGAIKGLGGYHLTCDASNADAVRALRERKGRDAKPFAVMLRDPAAAAAWCEVSEGERALLRSPAAPIVLLRRRTMQGIAEEVTGGSPWLGVMLPYSPLHHLLMRAVAPMPVVLTSGNRGDEPIVYRDEEAVSRLLGLAERFLVHDRRIQTRCDDSVTRWLEGGELPVRRSRGYAPLPLTLPWACDHAVLALGGQAKATFALGVGHHALVSHHLGDLDQVQGLREYLADLAWYRQLFGIRPAVLAHDLHPDYATTALAHQIAERERLACVGVQHHHAHLASCLVDNGLDERAIGVTFDGTGYGIDGSIWGGEFLVGDCAMFERGGHLRAVAMPGGEQAIREPWRMALAHLEDAGIDLPAFTDRLDAIPCRAVRRMVAGGVNAPRTSSVGRLFDAVASLLGLRDRVGYDGQAAVELEALVLDVDLLAEVESLPFAVEGDSPIVVDTRPTIRAVVEAVRRGEAARAVACQFHRTLVEMIAETCVRLRGATGVNLVALSGGVFLNVMLTTATMARLRGLGFRVVRHCQVPPNDGGLSLGQLAVAARRVASGAV